VRSFIAREVLVTTLRKKKRRKEGRKEGRKKGTQAGSRLPSYSGGRDQED
jgi:hypothetical protein